MAAKRSVIVVTPLAKVAAKMSAAAASRAIPRGGGGPKAEYSVDTFFSILSESGSGLNATFHKMACYQTTVYCIVDDRRYLAAMNITGFNTSITLPERTPPATSIAKYSRVNSSSIVRNFNCYPLAQASNTKS